RSCSRNLSVLARVSRDAAREGRSHLVGDFHGHAKTGSSRYRGWTTYQDSAACRRTITNRARREYRGDVSTGAEVREGSESRRCRSSHADRAGSQDTREYLLRGTRPYRKGRPAGRRVAALAHHAPACVPPAAGLFDTHQRRAAAVDCRIGRAGCGEDGRSYPAARAALYATPFVSFRWAVPVLPAARSDFFAKIPP